MKITFLAVSISGKDGTNQFGPNFFSIFYYPSKERSMWRIPSLERHTILCSFLSGMFYGANNAIAYIARSITKVLCVVLTCNNIEEYCDCKVGDFHFLLSHYNNTV